MAGGNPSSDDLDELLDSALDDFNKLDLSKNSAASSSGERKSGPSNSSHVQGLGMGLPGRTVRRVRGKQRAAAAPPLPPRAVGNYASEALEKLTQQTREAVKGLETATTAVGPARGDLSLNDEAMVEEFVKQFEELAGSQDMESIVESMMQQLLSKEILQEPMKEIAERYPKWLEEHKQTLAKQDFERYSRQYQLIVTLNDVYETDPENFTKIVDLMQKMQECGQPPNDIVQEIAPDLDLNNLGQLSPEMMLDSPNCSIM